MADSYVLQVTQSWRGRDSKGQILPLHWAITVKTAGSDNTPIGMVYNAAGNIDTFFYETVANVSLKNTNWRGALTVGSLPKEILPNVERVFSQVPIVRHDYNWNCQNWVWASLRELRQLGYPIKPNLTWEVLRAEMNDLLDAWEAGDI
ncbi:hypothetical protein AcW1_000523 [Taiwanofungus camphoratus]|nr:hypothetical protein AcW2_000982 [Antrodia cinnamomea]KAI0936232.1 hypothetical protein AcV5_004423 [Antrodia cinnamomea]KAI0961445.1 hypothetical protein AcV7_000544 [Antrodia cinnamomea]KAI0963449.1 hypothetical protein AcW1_000523 [Antrodia cinnamomea]